MINFWFHLCCVGCTDASTTSLGSFGRSAQHRESGLSMELLTWEFLEVMIINGDYPWYWFYLFRDYPEKAYYCKIFVQQLRCDQVSKDRGGWIFAFGAHVKISWEKTPTYIAGKEVFQISCMRIFYTESPMSLKTTRMSYLAWSADQLVRLSSQVLLTLGTRIQSLFPVCR